MTLGFHTDRTVSQINFKHVFHTSIVAATDIVAGDIAWADAMTYEDARVAYSWPGIRRPDGEEDAIDWIKARSKKASSLRFGCYGIWNENAMLAGIRMGATRLADRIAITDISRDVSNPLLKGHLAQIGMYSLLLAGATLKNDYGISPKLAILNPFPTAVPHYEATASSMNLQTHTIKLGATKGSRNTLLFIDVKD